MDRVMGAGASQSGEMSTDAVDKKVIERVFAAGTRVELRPLATPALSLCGVMHGWHRRDCLLRLAAGDPAVLPSRGAEVELLCGRLDGLFRIAGVVRQTRMPDSRAPGKGPQARTMLIELRIRVDSESAQRRQRRAYFRLPGCWPARIDRPAASGIARAAAAVVHDLSAGGMLIDDREGLLEIGRPFAVTVDLQDELAPLTLEAVPVRHDPAPQARRWGCRFVNSTAEDEDRILGRLHVLTRLRLAAERRNRLASELKPDYP